MRELKNKRVRCMAERHDLIQELLTIEAMPKGNDKTLAKMKWTAELRAHKHEFAEYTREQEEEDTLNSLKDMSVVTTLYDNSWFAYYRHASASVDSMFHADVSFVTPSIKTVLGLGDDVDPNDLDSWVQGMHPDDAERVLAAQIESRDKYAPFDQCWRTWHAGHDCYRYIRAISKAVWDPDNPLAPAYFEGIIFDVTEHVEARYEKGADQIKSAMLQLFAPMEKSEV